MTDLKRKKTEPKTEKGKASKPNRAGGPSTAAVENAAVPADPLEGLNDLPPLEVNAKSDARGGEQGQPGAGAGYMDQPNIEQIDHFEDLLEYQSKWEATRAATASSAPDASPSDSALGSKSRSEGTMVDYSKDISRMTPSETDTGIEMGGKARGSVHGKSKEEVELKSSSGAAPEQIAGVDAGSGAGAGPQSGIAADPDGGTLKDPNQVDLGDLNFSAESVSGSANPSADGSTLDSINGMDGINSLPSYDAASGDLPGQAQFHSHPGADLPREAFASDGDLGDANHEGVFSPEGQDAGESHAGHRSDELASEGARGASGAGELESEGASGAEDNLAELPAFPPEEGGSDLGDRDDGGIRAEPDAQGAAFGMSTEHSEAENAPYHSGGDQGARIKFTPGASGSRKEQRLGNEAISVGATPRTDKLEPEPVAQGAPDLYTLVIEGPLPPEEREKLADLVLRNDLQIRESDLSIQFKSGQIYLPKLSEYTATIIAQAMRGTSARLRVFHASRLEALSPEARSSQVGTSLQDVSTKVTLAAPTSHPAEAIPITQDSWMPGIEPSAIEAVRVLTATAILKPDEVADAASAVYQSRLDNLCRELRFRAHFLGIDALLSFTTQLTPLSLSPHYRLTVSVNGITLKAQYKGPLARAGTQNEPRAEG